MGRAKVIRAAPALLAALLVAAMLTACSGRGSNGAAVNLPAPPVNADPPPVTTASNEVTVVDLGGGARLIVPPGAMAAGATVTASYKNPPSGEWGSLRPVSAPVEIVANPPDAIHGLLTLEFPVPAGGGVGGGEQFGISTFDPSTGMWVEHPSTYDSARHLVVAQIAHFSWWNPFSWDWAGIFARINQRVGEMVGKRAPSARCSRGQPVPGWATGLAGISNDGAIAVRACAEGEGDVLAVELVNNRPYSMVLRYGSGVKWGWHEGGDSVQDAARNALADRFVRADELYLPPLGRASVGIFKTTGHKVFSAGVTTLSLTVDALDNVLGDKIRNIPRAGSCLQSFFQTPIGDFSPGRVRDGVSKSFSCVVREASAAGYFDSSTISQLESFGRNVTFVGRVLKFGDYEWKFLDLFVDNWIVGDAGGLGAGFSFLGRSNPAPIPSGSGSQGVSTPPPPPPPPPPTGGTLTLSVSENPFRCDGESRSFGRLTGAAPGERIDFSSPRASGLLSGNADSSGALTLKWQCNPGEGGQITLSARSASGRTGQVTFSQTTPAPTPTQPPPPPPPPPPPQKVWREQMWAPNGANSFSNYHNASGMGPHLDHGAWVEVSCKVYDPTIPSVSPGGYWYRIHSSPWNDQYYIAANTFYNGDPPGGPYTHSTDMAVRDC